MTDNAIATIDRSLWPDVAALPRSPVRAAVARALLRRVAERLPIWVDLPDGNGFGGRTDGPNLRLRRPEDFFHRVGVGGLIGFGESYQAGDWDGDDLVGLLTVLASRIDRLVPRSLQWLRRAYVAAMPSSQDNTVGNAERNVSLHYDLSNDLFGLFLDETMTYSAALFGDRPATWESLAEAQHAKIDRLLDLTGVTAGSRVLEIGTGWGELALRAAGRGATVHSVTLSREQLDYARRKVSRAGADDRVTLELRDYRDLRGSGEYDAILSVEMIEAVGMRHWPDYFETLDRLLIPGGRVGIQAITMPHDRMMATRDTYTWIHKYIFPGGIIPSIPAIREQVAATGLSITDIHRFGQDYGHTLRLWRQRLESRRDELAALGFDEVFGRTWDFYLAYSQAGFASGYLDVAQIVLGVANDHR